MSRILVPIKRVVDYNVKIHFKPDHSGVELANVKMSMNPFDEIALEEALRLKEAGVASEVICISIGPAPVAETLRTGLAMGADSAIHVATDAVLEPLGVAKILKAIALSQEAQIILMGKQAIDDDCNQTGQMLAGFLDWGQATFASEVKIADGKAQVTREVDGGLRTLSLPLPCVITTDLRLNEPRYVSLPNIMKAKKKPLEEIALDTLGLDVSPRHKTLQVAPPPPRAPGVRVGSVQELVAKLKQEAGVLAS